MLIRFERGKKQPFVFCPHCSSVTSFQGLMTLEPESTWQLILVYIHYERGIILGKSRSICKSLVCEVHRTNMLFVYANYYFVLKCACELHAYGNCLQMSPHILPVCIHLCLIDLYLLERIIISCIKYQ